MNYVSKFNVYGEDIGIRNDMYERPEYYGAKADGVTNCSTSIQKALTEAAKKHGIVYFEDGVYISGKLTIPSNVTLMGAKTATLKAANGLSGEFLTITDGENVTIDGLKIDGNKDNVLSVKNRFECDNFTIRNCTICNFNAYNPIQCFGNNVAIIANHVYDTENCDLIAFSSGSNCVIANNITENAADTDIVVAANAKNVSVVGNVCIRNNTPIVNAQMIAIAGADDVTVVGNVLKGNNSKICGIRIYQDPNTSTSSHNIIIADNVVDEFEQTQGIVVTHVDGLIINGNIFKNCGDSCYIDDSTSNIEVSSNNMIDALSGILFANGHTTNASLHDNIIKGKADTTSYGVRFVNQQIENVNINGNVVQTTEGLQKVSTTTQKLLLRNNVGIDERSTVTTPTIEINADRKNEYPFSCHVYLSRDAQMQIVADYGVFNISGSYAYLEPNDVLRIVSDVSGLTWTWMGGD